MSHKVTLLSNLSWVKILIEIKHQYKLLNIILAKQIKYKNYIFLEYTVRNTGYTYSFLLTFFMK